MGIDRRGMLMGTMALGMFPAAARAQTQPAPQKTQAEIWEEARQKQLKEDWPWLGRYAADNAKLLASGAKTNIVFIGDSITEGWVGKRPGFFTPGRVGRGISGQTTPQMVLRMMADVIALKPKAVHIMAGTNDIAGNTGVITPAQTHDNLRMMAQLAKANGLQVLLASVPPADHFPWRPGLEVVGPIREINGWAQAYAKANGMTYVDYTAALATPEGAMKPGMAFDGVHPTEQGYDVMASVLEPILKARKL